MQRNQGQTPDPDVNSYIPNVDPGASRRPEDSREEDDSDNIEGRRDDRDVIPVPPDAPNQEPIEAPPHDEGEPVGDVDDSPKRIAGQ